MPIHLRQPIQLMLNMLADQAQQILVLKGELQALKESVGSGNKHSSGVEFVTMPSVAYSLASNTTMGVDDLNRLHNVNCTSSCTLTLPIAAENSSVSIFNGGTGTLTISDGSHTLCALTTNMGADFHTMLNSNAIAVWPTVVATETRDGIKTFKNLVVITDSSLGVVQFDGTNFWRTGFLSTGALNTTNIGSTPPSSSLASGAT
jgi:hypothetical protein